MSDFDKLREAITEGDVFKPATEDEVRQRKIDLEQEFDAAPAKWYDEWESELVDIAVTKTQYPTYSVEDVRSMVYSALDDMDLDVTSERELAFLEYFFERHAVDPDDFDELKQLLGED